MLTQKKPEKTKRALRSPPRRSEYLAAVRHLDGRSELFRIRNADDLADARALVHAEVGEVRAILISPCR